MAEKGPAPRWVIQNIFKKEDKPMWKKVIVRETERALVLERGRLVAVLGPGVHRVWTFARDIEIEILSTLLTKAVPECAAELVRAKSALVDEYFERVIVTEGRVAVVFADKMLIGVFGPGETALIWKAPRAIEIREFDIVAEPEVDAAMLPALTRMGANAAKAQFVTVPDQTAALVYVNGKFVRVAGSGVTAFWTALGAVRVDFVDLRRQMLDINGQEMLTKDKVTLRVNIAAEYRVVDPVLAASKVRNAGEVLYRLLQLAVRRAIGLKTLDELLADKVEIDAIAAGAIRAEMLSIGVEVGAMALKDVILPGEIREILNQVVAAEKQAQANLIKRREETAAARSLLNTAKLMEESPLLLRLKELETLEKLTEKVGSVTVTGGFEGMLEKLLVPIRK